MKYKFFPPSCLLSPSESIPEIDGSEAKEAKHAIKMKIYSFN